jgi:hypothetical protein
MKFLNLLVVLETGSRTVECGLVTLLGIHISIYLYCKLYYSKLYDGEIVQYYGSARYCCPLLAYSRTPLTYSEYDIFGVVGKQSSGDW